MKRRLLPLFAAFLASLAPLLAACRSSAPDESRLTELRAVLYRGETKSGIVTAWSGYREIPYVADGEVGNRRDVLLVRLEAVKAGNYGIEVVLDGTTYAAAFAANPVSNRLTLTLEMPRTDAATLEAVLVTETGREPLTLGNAVPQDALGYRNALEKGYKALADVAAPDRGEYSLRLTEENGRIYWLCSYAADGHYTAVLLSAADGEVIARHTTRASAK